MEQCSTFLARYPFIPRPSCLEVLSCLPRWSESANFFHYHLLFPCSENKLVREVLSHSLVQIFLFFSPILAHISSPVSKLQSYTPHTMWDIKGCMKTHRPIDCMLVKITDPVSLDHFFDSSFLNFLINVVSFLPSPTANLKLIFLIWIEINLQR